MGEFKHDLIMHLRNTFSIIAEVEPDNYWHMDMLNDICKDLFKYRLFCLKWKLIAESIVDKCKS